MDALYTVLAVAGTTAVVLGLFSAAITRTPLSEPMLAMALGILVGPQVLGWIEPQSWGPTEEVMSIATRLTLAIGLMGVALRLDHRTLRRVWRPAAILLTLGMIGMWALSSLAVGWWMDVGVWGALLIGAAVTPTDPIVSSAIVSGPVSRRDLPDTVRGSLSLESGANDGLAYLFAMLPMMALTRPDTMSAWIVDGVVRGVLLGAATGAVLGFAAARLLEWAKRRGLVEEHSLLSLTVALSLAVLGICRLLDSNAIIAVFTAGLTFNLASDTGQQHAEENIQEAINKLFSIPIFILLGALLPWQEWALLGWPLLGLAVTVLLLRRPPVFVVLLPLLSRFYTGAQSAYLAWFGPVGIAALFYAAEAWKKTGDATVWHATTAVVAASILVHGISAAPLTALYARRLPTRP